MTTGNQSQVKVLVLHSRLSGYFVACLNQLANSAQVTVVAYPGSKDAPFDDSNIAASIRLIDRHDRSLGDLNRLLAESSPDLILVSGWFDSDYATTCRMARDKGIPVIIGIDTPSPKQFLARVRLRLLRNRVQACANYIWVPGTPQAMVGKLLGYRSPFRLTGMYTCDDRNFLKLPIDSIAQRKKFLFVGRFAKVKGIRLLVDAYHRYRQQSRDPWSLICTCVGPERDLLLQQPGIEVRPFVQPRDLASVYAEASAFVMPSQYEPWGVVIHEAASAGLPLICSDACGAAAHLLQDRYNGLVFSSGDRQEIVASLLFISNIDAETHQQWSSNSRTLASQYSPRRWALTLLSVLQRNQQPAPMGQ